MFPTVFQSPHPGKQGHTPTGAGGEVSHSGLRHSCPPQLLESSSPQSCARALHTAATHHRSQPQHRGHAGVGRPLVWGFCSLEGVKRCPRLSSACQCLRPQTPVLGCGSEKCPQPLPSVLNPTRTTPAEKHRETLEPWATLLHFSNSISNL